VNLDRLLAEEQSMVESALRNLLPTAGVWPERLHRAMAHAVFAGGKRVRPVLARLTHRVVHVAFDEATAILVGDALLAEGLLFLARYPQGALWSDRRAEAVEMVAEAISARGMVGGQMEDLEATGPSEGSAVAPEERLDLIHRHKTGCLLRASVELGAILAGVDGPARRRFTDFGEDLGLAFQVADDVLDATASADDLGKSPGKDSAAGKLTYVTLYGLDTARRRLDELERKLIDEAIEIEGADGELAAIASYVCRRRS